MNLDIQGLLNATRAVTREKPKRFKCGHLRVQSNITLKKSRGVEYEYCRRCHNEYHAAYARLAAVKGKGYRRAPQNKTLKTEKKLLLPHVGALLKRARLKTGISHRELAYAMGVSPGLIYHAEIGKWCSLEFMALFARHVSCRLRDLIPEWP